jgi:hypothetical protein
MKTIRLASDHWQAGVFYPAGSTVELPDEDAAFVIAQEIQRRAARVGNHDAMAAALEPVIGPLAAPTDEEHAEEVSPDPATPQEEGADDAG